MVPDGSCTNCLKRTIERVFYYKYWLKSCNMYKELQSPEVVLCVLKTYTKLTGKNQCLSPLFNKVASLIP